MGSGAPQDGDATSTSLVRRHLAEFLERCEERAGPLPAFVKGELEGFAGCGDFELGFGQRRLILRIFDPP